MKVILATPLFPPDTGGAAPYVKELAKRLALRHHVTLVAYGKYPESVPGVTFVPVDKGRPLLLRLIAFFFALREAVKNADVLVIENGASVELPAYLVARLTHIPLFIHIGDEAAHGWAKKHPVYRKIEKLSWTHAAEILRETPMKRPEILPFESLPQSALDAYEAVWNDHVLAIERTLQHGAR